MERSTPTESIEDPQGSGWEAGRSHAAEYPLTLPMTEYARAAMDFMEEAHEALLHANSPLVGRMPRQRVEALPITRYVFESEVVEMAPEPVEAAMTMRLDAVKVCDIDELMAMISDASATMAAQLQRQLLDHIQRLTEATGQVVSGAGKDPVDAILESLEVMEMSIDDDGNLALPTLVMNPDAQLPELTPDQNQRLNELLARKEAEARARRPARRLR